MSGIRDISVQQLLDRFVDVCLDQEDALSDEDYDKFNELYDVRMDIQDELKRRGDKARRSLLRLYDHPNLTVQMFAAAATAGPQFPARANDGCTHCPMRPGCPAHAAPRMES